MKIVTNLVLLSLIAFGAIMSPQSLSGAPARDAAATFNDVGGKEWLLLEVKSAGKTITLDRQKLSIDNFIGAFSLSFQEDRVSGMGAPNRYFAPYSFGANRSLSIGQIASTMMLAFREPDDLKEKEFFDYLSKVKRWDLSQGKLELYSVNTNGSEVILVFVLK